MFQTWYNTYAVYYKSIVHSKLLWNIEYETTIAIYEELVAM